MEHQKVKHQATDAALSAPLWAHQHLMMSNQAGGHEAFQAYKAITLEASSAHRCFRPRLCLPSKACVAEVWLAHGPAHHGALGLHQGKVPDVVVCTGPLRQILHSACGCQHQGLLSEVIQVLKDIPVFLCADCPDVLVSCCCLTYTVAELHVRGVVTCQKHVDAYTFLSSTIGNKPAFTYFVKQDVKHKPSSTYPMTCLSSKMWKTSSHSHLRCSWPLFVCSASKCSIQVDCLCSPA